MFSFKFKRERETNREEMKEKRTWEGERGGGRGRLPEKHVKKHFKSSSHFKISISPQVNWQTLPNTEYINMNITQ